MLPKPARLIRCDRPDKSLCGRKEHILTVRTIAQSEERDTQTGSPGAGRCDGKTEEVFYIRVKTGSWQWIWRRS